MLNTHADAIDVLQGAGIPASRRHWALGDTIVVPLGRPSTRDGITAHPSVAWLVPSTPGWRLEQPVAVANTPRVEMFSDLDAACERAIEIARSFTPSEPCTSCGHPTDLDFGERNTGDGIEFWVSSRCSHCGAQVESDGASSLPENLRQLEYQRHGVWAVFARPPIAAAHWQVLRRELQLSLSALTDLKALLPGRVFSGTFAEAARLCRVLVDAEVLANLEQAG